MMLVIACGDVDARRLDAWPTTFDANSPEAADAPVWCRSDSDRDGVPDPLEGEGDADGDGTPNHHDADSDGDGTGDAEARRTETPMLPAPCWSLVDEDADGAGDPYDLDDDNDLLSDRDEAKRGLDPLDEDGNDDGCIDGVEVRFGGCSDPRVESLMLSCGSENTINITFELAEAHPVLTLEPAPVGSGGTWVTLTVEALSVSPARAARIEADRFEDVRAGATVTFLVRGQDSEFHSRLRAFLLELRDETAVIEQRALIVSGMTCPVLI
jgi:hypothetical protein